MTPDQAHPEPGSPQTSTPPRVAVIGGGISGLAAAHRLRELLPMVDLTLFEADDRLGGVIDTVRRGDFLVERSADNFVNREPWAMDLCQRLGIADKLLATDETRRRAFVVRRGRLEPIPTGFVLMAPGRLWPLMTSPLLSPWGRLRVLCEPLLGREHRDSSGNDESVACFARRRMGREAFERIVQPLLAGIYTGDAERLSMAATMPQFLEYEQRYGSVLHGLWRARRGAAATAAESGARYGLFVAPRDGMASLVAALAAQLPAGSIHLGAPIARLAIEPQGGWRVRFAAGREVLFDGVLVATPAHVAGKLLGETDPELGQRLTAIEYAGSVVVSLALGRDQVRHPLDGFGLVVPRIEARRIIAASFASVKYPGRAPDGGVLVRVFIGGALQPELTALGDEELVAVARDELAALVGLNGAPRWADVARWPASMPQYHVGHLDRVSEIERLAALRPGLELAGSAYRGVGIPQCIHSGEQAAERMAKWLTAIGGD